MKAPRTRQRVQDVSVGRTHQSAERLAGRSPLASAKWLEGMPQAESIRPNNLVYELRAAGHDVITLSLGEINNPNNPSGHVYSAAELRFIHALAAEHDLLIIADGAYNEFVPEGIEFRSCAALDPDKTHTAVINSMSKNYGVSGWRVGYVIAHRDLVDQILKINQHLVTCAPTISSVPSTHEAAL